MEVFEVTEALSLSLSVCVHAHARVCVCKNQNEHWKLLVTFKFKMICFAERRQNFLICKRTYSIVTDYKNVHTLHFKSQMLSTHSVCMFLYFVMMENVLLHISEVSHVTPLQRILWYRNKQCFCHFIWIKFFEMSGFELRTYFAFCSSCGVLLQVSWHQVQFTYVHRRIIQWAAL
jgi:hypothetical protein